MVTRKEVNVYREILEDGTYYQAINTMLGLHLRVTAIIRTAIETKDATICRELPTQIKDLWEDVTMNIDYNEYDCENLKGESQLGTIALKLAMSELVILGYKVNDARDFLTYDNDSTLSIRLF